MTLYLICEKRLEHICVISRWSKDKSCRWVGEFTTKRQLSFSTTSGRSNDYGNKFQLALSLGMPTDSPEFEGILREMEAVADTAS